MFFSNNVGASSPSCRFAVSIQESRESSSSHYWKSPHVWTVFCCLFDLSRNSITEGKHFLESTKNFHVMWYAIRWVIMLLFFSKNDNLVLQYANKTLEYVPSAKRYWNFFAMNSTLQSRTDYFQSFRTLQDVKLWLMDETNAETMRRQHYYSSAPNYLLTIALLNLCFDTKKVWITLLSSSFSFSFCSQNKTFLNSCQSNDWLVGWS